MTFAAGNLYFTDLGPGNRSLTPAGSVVRALSVRTGQLTTTRNGIFYGVTMTAGDIYTIAGGGTSTPDGVPATRAAIEGGPIALDGVGNLVIGEPFAHRVLMVPATSGTFYGMPMTIADIYTIAGAGGLGFSTDGTPASDANGGRVKGLAAWGGDVVFSDMFNTRVRAVTGSGTAAPRSDRRANANR
jgi:hypothetical protein